MGYPDKPEELKLHPLEEVLASPVIPFITIRDLPVCGQTKGGQKAIRGNVAHVPNDISPTLHKLPQTLNDMVIVSVQTN